MVSSVLSCPNNFKMVFFTQLSILLNIFYTPFQSAHRYSRARMVLAK